MKKIIFLSFVCFLFSACQSQKVPPIVPAVEVKSMNNSSNLDIIGAIEPVYFLPMKSPFEARIDTGAENSSIDVDSHKLFERDGEKWVSFVLTNRETGESHRFEKKVLSTVKIKRINEHEKRITVLMDVKFGDEIIKEKFSLADREKFEYQALIGRNILTGRAIVDTSLSHTFR